MRWTFDWLVVALLALGCAGGDGSRLMWLDREHVEGFERLCIYQDALGTRAITIDSWERCPPVLEVEDH